jgi:hypothetical protein
VNNSSIIRSGHMIPSAAPTEVSQQVRHPNCQHTARWTMNSQKSMMTHFEFIDLVEDPIDFFALYHLHIRLLNPLLLVYLHKHKSNKHNHHMERHNHTPNYYNTSRTGRATRQRNNYEPIYSHNKNHKPLATPIT